VEDIEVKRALVKELQLYDFGSQKVMFNELANFYDFVDAYHYGLARCAVRDESGAQLIEFALKNIQKYRLIEITLRNIDHPLIAAAGISARPLCANAINLISEKIKE
jgi:hypothetical protein